MVAIKSKYFKQGKAENFRKILKVQKKDESDPKFAISDSLQEYQQQLEKSAGYQNQVMLDKAKIRQDVINFVIDYSISDLDQLKGMDFDEAKTQQKTTEKSIKEFEGLRKKDVLTKIHGGGATDRKRKLLEKQKKGKARSKQFGRVEIPQEAFIGVLKINKDK